MFYTTKDIPTWEQARDSVESAQGSSMARLIYNFAPHGSLEESFREQLAAALNEAVRVESNEWKQAVDRVMK